MKRWFGVLILMGWIAGVQAQLPWSAPELLVNTVGENLSPQFVRGDAFAILDFQLPHILLWERRHPDHSRIFLKDFTHPNQEVPLTPAVTGVYVTHPRGTFIVRSHPDSTILLIVWQSNENGNADLFSGEYRNGELTHIRQITTSPERDRNADLFVTGLVWENSRSIYFSRYNPDAHSWSTPLRLDSLSCAHPALSGQYDGFTVVYEKTVTSGVAIARLTSGSGGQQWGSSYIWSAGGENHLPRFARGLPFIPMWEHRDGGDWDIAVGRDWFGSSPVRFSAADEQHPAGAENPIVQASRPQNPVDIWTMYLAFQSNESGDWEIYVNDFPYDGNTLRNISQHPGWDGNPVVSEFSPVDMGLYRSRLWVAWERIENGVSQIWGSFTEVDLVGIPPEPRPVSERFELYPNYPNPFNPTTTITFYLSQASHSTLEVFDLTGHKIKTLVNRRLPAGYHTVQWDGTNDAPTPVRVTSGVYLYRLQVGDQAKVRKMVLIR